MCGVGVRLTAPETDEVVSSEAMRILDLLLKEMPLKRAAALAAEITGERKTCCIRWRLKSKNRSVIVELLAIGCF